MVVSAVRKPDRSCCLPSTCRYPPSRLQARPQCLPSPAPGRAGAGARGRARGCHGLVSSDGSELTYVGHATVLIQLAGVRLLTDPLLGAGILHIRRRVPAPAVEALLPLDAVLVSHAHRDHLDQQSLRVVAGERPVVVPRGCGSTVRSGGARGGIELDEGD